ncbi:MAG: hypothetical protein HY928_12645 [Elusimicrobia bacterium]|nr:hypothetical protein [Elusimicrobiota bacterium]
MLPAHPFERLARPALGRLAASSSAAALALGSGLLYMGRPLSVPEVPYGLASFELAGGEAAMAALLARWGPDGAARAAAMTWLDFPFLVAYGLSLGSLSLLLGGARRFPAPARAAAWAAALAAVCDVAENILSLLILSARLRAAGPMAVLAAVKFLLAAASLAWVAAAPFIPGARD